MADQPTFTPAQKVAGTLSAAAMAVAMISGFEGNRSVGYRDIVGVPTACYGSTQGVVVGQTYSPDECMERLARDTVAHAFAIQTCLPDYLPAETRAAFISFAYNVGSNAFCHSTLSRLARAGQLKAACNELPKWVMAGGRRVQGLSNRRERERAFCLKGLP